LTKEILYSQEDSEEEPETFEELLFQRKISYYLKVGMFFGWDWQAFEATPYPVTKELSLEIDDRIANLSVKGTMFNWNSLSILDAVSTVLGGKTE